MHPSVANLRSVVDGVDVRSSTLRRTAVDGPFAFPVFARCVREVLSHGSHLFQVDSASCAALAAGFVAAVLRVLDNASQIMWVCQRTASSDAGAIYGPGLHEFGLAPERVLFVDGATVGDCLWAIEEGLRSKAVGAVVGEFAWATHKLDLTATRRLALRSEAAATPAYLTAVAGDVGPTAALTRWRISGAPSRPPRGPTLLGEPTWTLDLLKNRAGTCGRVVVGFSSKRGEFFPANQGALRSGSATFATSRKRDAQVAPLVAPFNVALRFDDEADRR